MVHNSVYVNLPDSPPDGRQFWLEESQFSVMKDGKPRPYFYPSNASRVFFGRSGIWLKQLMQHRPELFYLEGKAPEVRYAKSGYRYLSLADIERFAHALFQNYSAYPLLSLATTLNIIKYNALLWGYLDIDGNRRYSDEIPSPWKNVNKTRGD